MEQELFEIKRGDTSPGIEYALQPAALVNLTGATVLFKMRVTGPGGATVVNAAGTVVTPTVTPTVRYAWSAPDTLTKGLYDAEFEVTYSGGSKETFPNNGFISVRIYEDI